MTQCADEPQDSCPHSSLLSVVVALGAAPGRCHCRPPPMVGCGKLRSPPPPPSAVGTCRFQDMWLDVLVWLLAHSLGGLGWLGPLRCRGGGGLLSVVGRLEPWDPGRAPDIFILYPTDHVISESVCNTEQI